MFIVVLRVDFATVAVLFRFELDGRQMRLIRRVLYSLNNYGRSSLPLRQVGA